MKYSIVVTLSMLLLLSGCNPPADPSPSGSPRSTPTPVVSPSASVNPPVAVGDTTQNSVDWAGTYQGVLPCADCEGIDTELVLNEDGTFKRTMTYLGKEGEPVVNEGSFTWTADGGTVEMTIGDETARYFVGESYATQLDMEGNKITGDMADKYVLQKSRNL
jgi:uncharacterized lipoprotein NlpE involved in copper resistance